MTGPTLPVNFAVCARNGPVPARCSWLRTGTDSDLAPAANAMWIRIYDRLSLTELVAQICDLVIVMRCNLAVI